ncbi:MAG: hypothetical protein ABI972_12030 [Acidobacteriota bacterium]
MLTILRWLVGIGCVLGLLMFGLILVVGKGFDGFRSGAGSEDLLRGVLTVGIPVLLVAMLVTVVGAGGRVLLHTTAVGVAAALAGVAWSVMRTNPGEGGLYAGFFVLWLVYYATTVRG